MNIRLHEYKKFIDDLVSRRSCVLARWVTDLGWPKLPENEKFNKLLADLTPEQRETAAEMVQRARDGGIGDTLAYLSEEINLEGLRLSRNGVEFAMEPYGTEMDYDWICRLHGKPWPEHQLEDEYKS